MRECIRVLTSRFVALFHRRRLDEELEDELRFHLDMKIQENLRNGMNPKEARRSALLSMGGLDQVKEKYRDGRSLRLLDDFFKDLRYGLHILYRNPVFASAAILTLALGIGANTAIFSVVNAVLLHPLRFSHPEELVQIKADWVGRGILPYFSGSEFQSLRHAGQIPNIAAYAIKQVNMSGKEGAERIMLGSASAGFFPLLGVQAQIGRCFLAGEEQHGAGQVAILSNGFWNRHFGGDPAVLGRSLILDGAAYSVIGILPSFFDIPYDPALDIWIPLQLNEKDKYGQSISLSLIGRVRQPNRIRSAQAELDGIFQAHPLGDLKRHIVVLMWEEEITENARLPLLLFLGTVGFVLLISCVNVSNLLLSRAAVREKEIAVRSAIGARRWRIVRQLLTESLLIAFMGGGLGLAITYWARGHLISLVSENLVRISLIPINGWVLGFALLIALTTAIVAGIVPALQTSRTPIGASLNDGSRGAIGLRYNRIRRVFIAVEIALVVVLLIGAGLLLKSLLILQGIDPGFRAGNILTVSIDLTQGKYPTTQSQSAYYEQVLGRLNTIPGIESVCTTAALPFGNFSLMGTGVEVEGLAEPTPHNETISLAQVSHRYFETMRIPVLAGRVFSSRDREGAPGAAIVDSAFVRRYFPNRSPVGLQITSLFRRRWTIVGVVGEVRQFPLEKVSVPHIYVPYLQSPFPIPRMSVVARCARDPLELAAPIRDALKNIDPDQPAFDIKTLEEVLSGSLRSRRTNFSVIGCFAVLALLLAFIGVYGVVSFSVNRRTHEIGVRMALGASRGEVLRMILGESMKTCVIGILIGLAVALPATRIISSLLYGVTATDAFTFATAFFFIAIVVLIASYLPARKAAIVDPARCLRYE